MTVLFLHIPKTAGSTLRSILQLQYKNRHAIFLKGSDPVLSFNDWLDNNTLEHIDLLFGHIDFGIHKNFTNEVEYVTMLRHPLNRIVSHYNYVKRESNHYLHSKVIDNNLSLKQFVENGYSLELNNGMVRVLIGAGGSHKNEYSKYNIPYGKCENWMLKEAKENIKQYFKMVGLQEEFEKSIVMLKRTLNWNTFKPYVSQNRAIKKYKQLDEDTYNVIRKYNELDFQLFEYVQDSFKNKWDSESLENTIGLILLKFINGLFLIKRMKNLIYRLIVS